MPKKASIKKKPKPQPKKTKKTGIRQKSKSQPKKTKKTSVRQKSKSRPKRTKKTSVRQKSKLRPKRIEKISPLKETFPLILTKLPDGPIISPYNGNNWESWQTFNTSAILLKDKVHFLYRAIGEDAISRLGYAVSSNGFKIDERLPQPVYEHPLIDSQPSSFYIFSFVSGGSFGGCEDPRAVRVNKEDRLYMTYTACDQGLRVALTSIKVEDFLNKKWLWKQPVFLSPPGQVHKNWVIFPEKIKGRYAILHSLSPQILIDYFDTLEFDGKTFINSHYYPTPQGSHWIWEGCIRGAGSPPIKTKEGWLVFYHAEAKGDLGKYKVGAMLLDLEDPTRVLYSCKEPIIESSELHENNGYKPGVVYASGAVVKNGLLLVYYGAADSYVCVAYADLEEFLRTLKKETKPTLKRIPLKKQ